MVTIGSAVFFGLSFPWRLAQYPEAIDTGKEIKVYGSKFHNSRIQLTPVFSRIFNVLDINTYIDTISVDADRLLYTYFSGHRGLLVVYVFVLNLLPNSPEWSPLLWTTGAPAPSSSQDPVSLRSRSRNDSNTVSVLVSLMHLLQVHYRFFVRGAQVTRITGRSRPPGGVGLTPRQYTAWNV